MPVYTSPATLPTGFFVTASVYNTELVENIKYFKDAPVFDTAVIIGAATTSGVRLDLESGVLAVREGDDSTYAPAIASVYNLPSGGSINFASGDVTVTHSTNTLTFGGAASGYIFNDGNVGIGVTPGSVKLDINGSLNAIRVSDVTTDATTKQGKWLNRHYTNSEEDLMVIYSYSTSTENGLTIGGGSGQQNAATLIGFYTAANTTTVAGTERMRITSGGNIAIGATARFYFDGVAGTGDTYIEENSANNLSIYVGGSRYLQLNGGQFYVQSSDLLIAATKKFYIDGGGDTYATEGTTNQWRFVCGGTTSMDITTNAVVSYGAVGIGFYGNGVGASTGTTVVHNSDGYLYRQSSSRRFKENIESVVVTDAQLDAFMATAPSWWDYKGQKNGALGFIAEDLAALPLDRCGFNPLVNYDGDGQIESNRDYALIAMHHLVIQRMQKEIDALKARIY